MNFHRWICARFILREDQGPSRIERLFLGYLDKCPRKWHEIGIGLARIGIGFARIGTDWTIDKLLFLWKIDLWLAWTGTDGLARNWHRICQDWHSFERPTASDRRVCIKFILQVDWRPSRIEHLFLGYLDKRPQKWPEIGTGLADWHRIGRLAQDWQKIGRLPIPIILQLAIAIIGTWQLQL